MYENIEALWIQVHLPHIKPIVVGCCYKPPNTNMEYLNDICSMIDRVTDENREMYLLGDFNVNWLADNYSMKNRLLLMSRTCNLIQIVSVPTRVVVSKEGVLSSSCIDHIYTNVPNICSIAASLPVGCSDHNLIGVSRRSKVPKARMKIISARSYKHFCEDAFLEDIKKVKWSYVRDESDPEIALKIFMEYFENIANRHAPIRKLTVRSNGAPWIDKDLTILMKQRDQAKKIYMASSSVSDKKVYCTLRNGVTKLNREKKRLYYQKRMRGDT